MENIFRRKKGIGKKRSKSRKEKDEFVFSNYRSVLFTGENLPEIY